MRKRHIWNFCLALGLSATCVYGKQTILTYTFLPAWNPTDISATDKVKFTILLKSKSPIFLLVYEMRDSTPLAAYWNGELEAKEGWEGISNKINLDVTPIEWKFEPKLLTGVTTEVAIPFSIAKSELLKRFGEREFFCRIALPVWGIGKTSPPFKKIEKIWSAWFKCKIDSFKCLTVSIAKESFLDNNGNSLPSLASDRYSNAFLFESLW